jgi:hypothetical protein
MSRLQPFRRGHARGSQREHEEGDAAGAVSMREENVMPGEPEYESIRRRGGGSADDGGPEYETMRRTGGDSRGSGEEQAGEHTSDSEDA